MTKLGGSEAKQGVASQGGFSAQLKFEAGVGSVSPAVSAGVGPAPNEDTPGPPIITVLLLSHCSDTPTAAHILHHLPPLEVF